MARQSGGSFAGSVFRLASGAGFAQLLTAASAPLLARLYAPDDFGMVAVFTAAVSILSVVVCLRYNFAVVLPRSSRAAANLLALSLLSGVAVGVVLLGGLLLFNDVLSGWKTTAPLVRDPWLLPAGLLAVGATLAFTEWSVRERRFQRVTNAAVVASLVTVGAQFAAAAMGNADGRSLVHAVVLGYLASAATLAGASWADNRRMFRGVHWRAILAGARSYRNFPLVTSWTGFLHTGAGHLPTLLLAAFFPSTVVGYYALSSFLLRSPIALVGQAITRVFYQHAAAAHHQGSLPAAARSTFGYLTALSVFPVLVLAVVGETLFVVLLGSEWAEAGVYTQILAPWGLMLFIASPLVPVFNIVEQQTRGLSLQAGVFASHVLALAAGGISGSPRITIALFSASGVLAYSHLVIRSLETFGVDGPEVSRSLFRRVVGGIPAVVILLLLQYMGVPGPVVLMVGGVAVVAYYFRIISTDPRMRSLFTSADGKSFPFRTRVRAREQ